MSKKRHTPSIRKSAQVHPPDDNQYGGKMDNRVSIRFPKSSKQPKTTVDYFRMRKPLNIYMTEELNELGRKTYFQRVFVLALNNDENNWSPSYFNLSVSQTPDFCEYFQFHLDAILATCEKKKSTADHLSGLFIAMGTTHSYLMVEGPEDMIANFFEELDLRHDKIWISSRVFLVEDKIGETYFRKFFYRRSATINVNEKFPLSTPNDHNLMAVQHLKVKEKVKILAETLSTQIKKTRSTLIQDSSETLLHLPADPYNKMLPEIQRIDLVLNAKKFYRTVKDFSLTYKVLQTHQDEDSFLWPIQDNYMPLEVFKRSEFDVNLTFGHYGNEEKKENEKKPSINQEESKPVG